ncbi:flavin reductase family protein [Paenibacillus pinistramenti]|uniref:flavin reductase family protein n=1 Tax=Paenibacillus pinistramenti TaxID=1768003 RepID=UPI0011084C61|nr:flavin reductase family protein [Paenibacillus pinistramenti]
MISIDPACQQERDNYKLLIGSIIPRPIAFITTLGGDGTVNAAPFSYFSIASSAPPILSVSVQRKNGEMKDTARNALSRRELVIHIVDESLAEEMNKTAAPLPPEQSELELTALTAVPSEAVAVPGIREAKIRMECVLEQWIPVRGWSGPEADRTEAGERAGGSQISGGEPENVVSDLLLVRVVRFHFDEQVYRGGYIEASALKPVSRLAGDDYAGLGDIFTLIRQR